MPGRFHVAHVSELRPGTGKVVEAQGCSIALFNVAGTFYAIDNACIHRGGPLGEGDLNSHIITCPLHGWMFDLTNGVCVTRPQVKTKTYPVAVDGGSLMLEFVPEPAEVTNGSRRAYLVRFGAMGHIGRFVAQEFAEPQRGDRVVVRTSRGLESGELLLKVAQEELEDNDQGSFGELLRAMTEEDEVLERALREGQQKAFDACSQFLAERDVPLGLVDVESLLDGETILFYYLGEPPSGMTEITNELAKIYEGRIQFRQFAERVEAGCGPGCGTAEGGGCSSCGDDGECGAESGCSVAGACGSNRAAPHKA